MEDAAYSNRELNAKFESVGQRSDSNRVLLTEQLDKILIQTTKTNGHVADAFKEIEDLKLDFNQWRSFINGGLTILSIFFVPVLLYIVYAVFFKHGL